MVLGIDLLPASAPEGAVVIQGNFLSPTVQQRLKDFLLATGQDQHGEQSVISDVPHEDIDPRVDVVMSDMLMNTSGVPFRDHIISMDLCHAALSFALETLKPNGHFLCKFYQGNEDNRLEKALRDSFGKVYREKPHSSRSESRENYFVAMRRRL
jgi:21S rRNA (uridine2791-2'-O)-methyltransferase